MHVLSCLALPVILSMFSQLQHSHVGCLYGPATRSCQTQAAFPVDAYSRASFKHCPCVCECYSGSYSSC